jgi:tetratricopeptide (TPR) repeat protein
VPAPESPRIAELRRRVHADPASIAFAQLAEEYRRAGNYHEAVRYCRTGLARHPGYLSARVTLGRALIEVGGLDEAAREFELVLASAPDNLAAIRGMAEIEQRRGHLAGALQYYQRALALARFDSELEETIARIGREMGQVTAAPHGDGLSFEQATSELLSAAERMPAAVVRDETPAPSTVTASAPVESTVTRKVFAGPRDATPPAGAPEAAEAAGKALVDFDALLTSFGVADAAPPALMEMLLSQPSAAPATPSPLSGTSAPPAVDAFAELERELRAFEAGSAAPGQEPSVDVVLAELETWARVLAAERAAYRA